jgi:mRNA interferase RelE/StbE
LAWQIKWSGKAERQLVRLSHPVQRQLLDYMDKRIALMEQPELMAKPLRGNLGKLWRYRIGDYRLVCDIDGQTQTICVLLAGHRREIYE